jgi:hypothetical protein
MRFLKSVRFISSGGFVRSTETSFPAASSQRTFFLLTTACRKALGEKHPKEYNLSTECPHRKEKARPHAWLAFGLAAIEEIYHGKRLG